MKVFNIRGSDLHNKGDIMSVLIYEKKDKIAYMTLNRPASLNAFSHELEDALNTALIDYRDDTSLLVAIITGAGGRAFSSGADLKEMTALREPSGSRVGVRMNHLELWKPVIAAIDGYALAGGFHLTLDCDIRIATAQSRLGDREARVSAVSANMNLLNMISIGEAKYLLLSGADISAEEAYHIGLIHKVLPDRDSMMREARSIAEEIKLASPLAVQAMKRLAYENQKQALQSVEDLCVSLRPEVYQTEDAKEATIAFTEKRPPIWKMC